MAIYIFYAENDLFKIGHSENVNSRLTQIQSASPIEVSYFVSADCDDSIEKDLHNLLSASRVRGEWFALSNTDLRKVLNVLKPYLTEREYELCLWDESVLPLKRLEMRCKTCLRHTSAA